jgi:nucleoside-diphosphate-sugar epimerase
LKAIITGANGFVGRELCKQLLADPASELVLLDLDLSDSPYANDKRATIVQGQLQDEQTRREALNNGCDVLIHLAAVPGGTSEANPDLSKQVNLEATIALFEEAAEKFNKPKIVYASSIAVLGIPTDGVVDDDCSIVPPLTYGCHKAMVELALADLHRRGLVNAVAIRLPGILARPNSENGLKSAYLSNIFHALRQGEEFVCPVSAQATSWIMSVQCCAENLIHAATIDGDSMPDTRVVTLPAVCTDMADLANSIASYSNTSADLVTYKPDVELEKVFGSYPPLTTHNADAAGFKHDGCVDSLVENVFAQLS